VNDAWPIPPDYVPRLRADLRLERGDRPPHPAVLCDEGLGVRFRLNAEAHRVVRAIDGKRDLAGLLKRLNFGGARRVTRDQLCRVVAFLNAAVLLEDPVGAVGAGPGEGEPGPLWMSGSAGAPGRTGGEVPLRFPPGARFVCQRTGMCCAGYTVGPIEDEVVDVVRAHRFSGNAALLAGRDPFDEAVLPDGGTVRVLRQDDSRCVFLDVDRGCLIHREIGAHAKPAICRAYPYTFALTPDGACWVGLNMECGGYAAGRESGDPIGAQEPVLRELLGQVTPFRVPDPVPLDAGSTLSWGRYAVLEEGWLALLGAGEEAAFRKARGLCRHLARLRGGYATPTLPADAPPWPAAADNGVRVLLQRVLRHCTVAGRRSFADGHVLSAELFVRVRMAAGLLLGLPEVVGEDLWSRATRHFTPRPGAVTDPRWDGLLNDLLTHAVFGKQVLRAPTLVAGLGLLLIRLWLGSALAAVVAAHTRSPRLEAAHVNEGLRTVNRVLREDSVRWLDPAGSDLAALAAAAGDAA
jgi:Fe-S-cluster containining protein